MTREPSLPSLAIVRVLRLVVCCLVALCAASVSELEAQRAIDWSTKPVLLLTIGQGDEVFEKFGHNSLVVWDDEVGQPLVYNWGMFDFNQPNFIGRFLSGDTKYWMEPFSMPQTVAAYQRLNRTVVAQEVQLSPSQKTRLVAMLRENAKEANKFYRYDYYRDNCSTRVRDALDSISGGAVRRALQASAGQGSYRWHTRRLLAYSAPLYAGIQLVLGVDADPPLTAWQEGFLPEYLSRALSRVELPAADGLPARPLLAPIDTIFAATREPEPATASSRLPLAAGVGVILAVLITLIARTGRIGAALAVGGWSLLCAVLGAVLCYMWFFTRHVFMANNPSVALVNPVWLLGIGTAFGVARANAQSAWRALPRWLLVVAVVGTAGAVLIGHAGSALELAALLLPGHAAVAFAAGRGRWGTDTKSRSTAPLSLLELEGLGREQWTGSDAAKHVKAERDAWC
jgi:Domain of unknown function (DUF4105)